jgi:hypothetical protein
MLDRGFSRNHQRGGRRMKKQVFVFCLAAIMLFGGTAMAQQQTAIRPMLDVGIKELGVSGNINLEGPGGGPDVDLNVSYGYFFTRNLEVGPFISFSRSEFPIGDGTTNTITQYGLGVFADYHLHGYDWVRFAHSVPYAGVSVALDFTDDDIGDDSSGLSITPRLGVKWFFRDYVAVDTNFYFAWASDDIYIRDGKQENWDFGINIGLRVYFQ